MKLDEELDRLRRPRQFNRSNRQRWYRVMEDYNSTKKVEEFAGHPKEVENASK